MLVTRLDSYAGFGIVRDKIRVGTMRATRPVAFSRKAHTNSLHTDGPRLQHCTRDARLASKGLQRVW
jgi:hypothetical protein